jgi:hypothetical protein
MTHGANLLRIKIFPVDSIVVGDFYLISEVLYILFFKTL